MVAHRAHEVVRGELGDRVGALRPAARLLALGTLPGVAEDRSGASHEHADCRVHRTHRLQQRRRRVRRSQHRFPPGAPTRRARTRARRGGRARAGAPPPPPRAGCPGRTALPTPPDPTAQVLGRAQRGSRGQPRTTPVTAYPPPAAAPPGTSRPGPSARSGSARRARLSHDTSLRSAPLSSWWSASTISLISCSKLVCGSQPRSLRALVASPIR